MSGDLEHKSRAKAGSSAVVVISRGCGGEGVADTLDLAKRMSHVLTGMLSALGVILWGLGHGLHWLVMGLLLELFFHTYELVQWMIVRDLVYKQLLENYVGFATVYVAYIAAEVAGGVIQWLH